MEIENVDEDSADIIITLKDGQNYIIEVATPQYLLSLMKENYILVKKLSFTKQFQDTLLICFTNSSSIS